MVAKRNPQVSRAVVKLRELSNDERARYANHLLDFFLFLAPPVCSRIDID